MSQRSNTFGSSPPPEDPPEDAPPTPRRQRLFDQRTHPAKRQRTKKSAAHAKVGYDDDRKLQLLDRLTRWMVFLYCSNFEWLAVLHKVYSSNLSADSYDYVTGRTKIFDNSKIFKHRTIENMEVSSTPEFMAYQNTRFVNMICSGISAF